VKQFVRQIEVPTPAYILRVQENRGTVMVAERASGTPARLEGHVEDLHFADLFQHSQQRLTWTLPEAVPRSENMCEPLGLGIRESLSVS
jgi:hypothetical protein